jgi:hypothetical protein
MSEQQEKVDVLIREIDAFMLELGSLRYGLLQIKRQIKVGFTVYDPQVNRNLINPGESVSYQDLVDRIQSKNHWGIGKAKKAIADMVHSGSIFRHGPAHSKKSFYSLNDGADSAFV